jgi:hypothetical protein
MFCSIRYAFFVSIFLVLLCGCSSGENPVAPDDEYEASALSDAGSVFQSLGILGVYELNLNPDGMTADLTPVRSSSIGEGYIVSGEAFFTMWPCTDCLTLAEIETTPEGYIKLIFQIHHPFFKGNPYDPPTAMNRLDLDIFDLAMIVVPSSTDTQVFQQTGVEVFPSLCAYTDGHTNELGELTGDTNPCPYFLVVDNSETGTEDYNIFEMGSRYYEFDTYFTGLASRFSLYLTMGYGFSAVRKDRLNPEYYNPEFNRKAAWKVEVTPPEGENPAEMGYTWTQGDTVTPYTVTVKVYDWQHGATVAGSYPDSRHKNYISAPSDVAGVSVEIPGMTSSLEHVTSPESGDGSPSDPLIFEISMVNENDIEAGEYFALVKVTDSRNPSNTAGDADSLVHTPDGMDLAWYTMDEFATYQVFTATVAEGDGIVVMAPNGGEFWEILTPATVTWCAAGPITNVDIDLSLDSGANYTVSIASGVPDTGIYNIPSIGGWNTENARIRITDSADPLVFDESDADFRISCAVPDAPTGLNASDGTYIDRVGLSWNSVTGADTYNIFRDSVLLHSGETGTTYDDTTAVRGAVYSYEVESESICGVSNGKSDPDDGYAAGCPGGDGNDTCNNAEYLQLEDSASGCVDQMDEDWYFIYTSPGGISVLSSIDLTVSLGATADIYIYGREPGSGCPGYLLTSETDTGSTTVNLNRNSASSLYIKVIGNSGMLDYTIDVDIVPEISNVAVEVYVATTDGTSGGTWPTRSSTELTHSIIMQMMTWANNFWAQYGYHLNWDESETFMSAQYYNLDSYAEAQAMHNAYGKYSNKLALYFVDQLPPGHNTAYCVVINPKSAHNDSNVYTVYGTNVWSWQIVVAHEHGHALGYYQDQYLYNHPPCSCDCGDDACLGACLGYTQYLFTDPDACYAGNLMYYSYSQPWSWYDLTPLQYNWINEFNFLYPYNYNWN